MKRESYLVRGGGMIGAQVVHEIARELDPGAVVAWIFNNEISGYRIK